MLGDAQQGHLLIPAPIHAAPRCWARISGSACRLLGLSAAELPPDRAGLLRACPELVPSRAWGGSVGD